MFSKDIQSAVSSDETDKRDRSLRNVVRVRQCEFWGWKHWGIASFLDELQGSFTFKVAVTMAFDMEELKVFGLGSEVAIVPEPLGPKEFPVIGILEALDTSITPRFSYGDKDYLDPQQEIESEDNPKGTRITIAPTKKELVVNLKKVGDSHGLPAADQAQSHGSVVFSSLRVKKDSVAVEIHDIERIEAPIVFDVSWPNEVCLIDIVDP